MVEFRILGPLEVVDDSGRLALGGQKQRALLGLLLIHAREVVSTDRIVYDLWGEQPPRTATTSVQNLVSQLRKLLPPNVLLTRPPGYVLEVEPDRIDLGRFERLVAEANEREPDERSGLLRDALALWHGPPLADLAYEAFVQTEIPRLEELRLAALEDRIEADLERGFGRELVGELEANVAMNPLREKLRGQLMLALYRAGRQVEALQAYQDARRALVDELGIEPGSGLKQLYRSVLRQEATLERSAAANPVEDHLHDVVKALLGGRLVLVLGAGVNQLEELGGEPLPGPADVAARLVRSFECPPAYAHDLARVAEYVVLTHGVGPLYDELHSLYDRDYAPGPVHRALADLARLLRGCGAQQQLIVTTNFDQALERAFTEAGEEFDVVSYLALGRHRGKFLHLSAEGGPVLVEVPNAYSQLSLERRTVILKIHGGIDRQPEREWDSFVVSEDDHIDYLVQAEIAVSVPVTLAASLRRSHFLFLGYPLQEWSLRVFLHRVWGREKVGYRSWVIGPDLDQVEQELWRSRGIDIVDAQLESYIAALGGRLTAAAVG